MYWTSLAAELRAMILEELIQEGNVAHCASVCREWQAAIEQHNFNSLKLTAQDIPMFKIMATRNLSLIRYIWCCIEVRDYDCAECDLDETPNARETNHATFKDGIRTILCALSKLPLNLNMTFDISIYSPSDSQHYFQYIRFEPANALSSRGPLQHARPHESMQTLSAPLQSLTAIDRMFPDIEFEEEDDEGKDDFWTYVPQVPCVTHLLLRRQTRRRWDPIGLSRLVATSQVCKICVMSHGENGGDITNDTQTYVNSELFFKSLVLNTMKRMTIFEDLNETYITANSTGLHATMDAEPVRTTSTKLTRQLAEASLGLQHLSAAFIIDARQFGQVRQPSWIWEQLQTLSITSRDLVPYQGPKVNDLIYSAAQAIKTMPKLQTMELWNGGLGHAAVFRYKSGKPGGGGFAIAWRASWALQFEPRVVAAWESVAGTSRDAGQYLQIDNELLAPAQIRSHGEAVLILELEIEVACSVSIQQIHREHL
ncbi:hypothetical protein BDV95DRAFT_600450 [Massariosphaeria phaeospora]|uniref:DUF6546 domain-containing protein n=1 Tax=Massariosphaeria phaeospora TaxID=100035 RepID=A0A7C8IF02_9PLEO|nr:hypothetical protein BDV95DRAFT_600450 [Massariosphaeria phaeospora]